MENKELSREELLKHAKALYEYHQTSDKLKNALECTFTELKESKDETIRKYLINYVKNAGAGNSLFDSVNTRDDILLWLEKQGKQSNWDFVKPVNEEDKLYLMPDEQKSSWWSEEDAKIREALIHLINEQDGFLTAINGISVKDILAWIEKQDGKDEEILILKDQIESLHAAIKTIKETNRIKLETLGKQRHIECGKQQVVNTITSMLTEKLNPLIDKSLDGTISCNEEMFMNALVEIRSFVNSPSFQIEKGISTISTDWNEDDEQMLNMIISDVLRIRQKCGIGTDEWNIRTKAQDWLNSLKERVRPKQEWSEEDEEMLENIIDDYDDVEEHNLCDDIGEIMWLKSLKQRIGK